MQRLSPPRRGRLITAALLLALATACAEDRPPVDAGAPDSGALDARIEDTGASDAGPADLGPRDADPADAGREDAGRPDSGRHAPDSGIPNGCGCAYGFHHECDDGQMCGDGFAAPVCWRSQPAGGLYAGACTATAAASPSSAGWAPCNATCVPIAPQCADVSREAVAAGVDAWLEPLHRVLTSTAMCAGPCRLTTSELNRIADQTPLNTCRVALGWTVLGVAEVCGAPRPTSHRIGDLPPLPWGSQWEAASTRCDLERTRWCVRRLRTLVSGQVLTDAELRFPIASCPAVPPGGPCADAACLARALRTAARTLLDPP